MDSVIKNNIEEIKQLFRKHGATSAFLFGSAVSTELGEESDADFLFRFRDEISFEEYADNYFSLAEALEKLLNRPVDLVAEKTLKNKNPYLIKSIDQNKFRLI